MMRGFLSEGVLSGKSLCLDGVMYGGGFVRGGFVRGGFFPEGVLSYILDLPLYQIWGSLPL